MTRTLDPETLPKKQVMLTLDTDDYDQVKSLADADDRSVASFIRRLVKRALAMRDEED